MIRNILFSMAAMLFAALLSIASAAEYDVVIVGGTPGGIMAAIAAAREGKDCAILERTAHVGGLPANGLGATDIGTRGATTGLFGQFVDMNRAYYVEKYGAGSPQERACSDGYHFEPHVAEENFCRMIDGAGPGRITVLTMRQFDSSGENVVMSGSRISAIYILNRETGDKEKYDGKVFIDATYEGDLGAAAGVPFRTGREGMEEFSEPCAGKVYRWWKHGPDEDGTTYKGDDAIQAYNYRICLTKDSRNRVPVRKPDNYNREEYVSLVEDVLTGRNTDVRFSGVTEEQMEANRQRVLAGGKTAIPGDPWGISKVTNMVSLPNGKTDANNQHLALISTDLPEENWPWPTAGWEWRDAFAARLRDYTLGLLWFAQNDEALPAHFREACLEYGLAADEYADNGNFPRQVYVREGRRLAGTYFFTANDVLPVQDGSRPPVSGASVTASHYALDSHAVHKREKGRVHLDGFFSHPSSVYTVPYGVMVPEAVDNLLFPVAVSGSHVGFSTLRMEPCWMAMGEAAGTAAALSIDGHSDVRGIPVERLQQKLLENGATLIYFRDLKPGDRDFMQVQMLALKGYFPGWNAELDKPLDEETAKLWSRLSGKVIKCDGGTRRQFLRMLEWNGINDSAPDWAWTGFVRPEGVNPVFSPDTATLFRCPVSGLEVPWEGSDTFNPGATVHKGKIVVMYRGEDNSGVGIGKRTSRLGYAVSRDGVHFRRSKTPVFYPDNDAQKALEWPGGCEDPRIAATEDGLYVMFYTQWNRKTARLAVATSRNLKDWTKYGPAFAKAYGGRFFDMFCKSASIITKVVDGKQVIAKIDGKYWMYWGERFINVATSDNLVDWTPMLDEKGELLKVVLPRDGYFDSDLTECGPPAVITDKGILLMYNGKNKGGKNRDRRYTANSYCAGQLLFDLDDPCRLKGRLDEPFFIPEASFEKSGQYPAGTVFIEGLVPYRGKWYLYYGCADSRVGVAIYSPAKSDNK
ncbi:MAG: FAD-dependent oxidoreductase [Clostridium sp.]|nr:FAD-dependent oxidoreductase [Clostridium sp.]